jgi:hypothetical protein
MYNKIPVLVLLFGIIGCDLGERAPGSMEPLSATFRLTDASSREATSFRSGEEFDVIFVLTNTTGGEVTFHKADYGPLAHFTILQGDSVVATSIDGYAFPMVATTGRLEPGQSLQEYWRAPNTPARDPRIVLTPGLYQARASFVSFDKVEVKKVPPIAFSIIR